MVTTLTLGACSSTPSTGVTSGTVLAPSSAYTGSPAATTAPSVTPLPNEGMLTGPGVNDASISLGLIVDAAADRGFADGVRLWRDTVNTTGGICGRTVQIVSAAMDSTPDDSYAALGRSTLGLVIMQPGAAGLALASRVRADRIPAFTPEGTSHKRTESGSPIVLGATDDILAINTAAHLLATGVIPAGGTLGVLVDDSATAADVMEGLTWWADRSKVTLRAIPEAGTVPAGIPAVFAAADPGQVASLLTRTASTATGLAAPSGSTPSSPAVGTGMAGSATVSAASTGTAIPGGATGSATGTGARLAPIIATTLDGFDPSQVPVGQAGRLLVATVTPSPGADHPGVKAVDAAYAAAGHRDIGPRMLEGYATGEIWARLLEPMCSARTLTRTAALADLAKLAPSSPDSLFGSTNPTAALSSGMPASRVSALSVADPAAPAGLRPVTLLESAPGIADYHSG